MAKVTAFKCDICGYVHHGQEPPEICPICGVSAELFSPLEISVSGPKRLTSTQWRCTICNYVFEGPEPPEICPICKASAAYFEPLVTDGSKDPLTKEGASRVVIVGAGVAGLTAVEQIRRISAQTELILVSKEEPAPYYRLNLTRYLAGEVTEAELAMHDPSWYQEQRVELLRQEVTRIEPEKHELQLRDGRVLSYDKLILASGAHPFIPPIAGATREGVQVVRTLDDCRKILALLGDQSRRCVVVGGGLLGLEVAGALQQIGAKVTVLEGFEWLLPRQLSPEAGKLLQAHVHRMGVEVRLGVNVKEITGDEAVRGVLLADGEELPAELVIIATGVRANSYLARQAGLKVGSGVIVNDRMQTSAQDVLAAGDVAEHRGVMYGIWPAAYAQGLVAGANAVGGTADFSGFPPSTRLKVLDVDLFSVGEIRVADGATKTLDTSEEGGYRRLVLRDGLIIGAILYGDTQLANTLKEAIESRTPVAEISELGL